jgi:hypothetical protein
LVVLGGVVHGYWSKLEHQFGRLKLGQSLLRMPTLFDAVRVPFGPLCSARTGVRNLDSVVWLGDLLPS